MLKYKFPILKLNVQIIDKNDTTRTFSKMFFFLVNTTNQLDQQPVVFQIEYKFGLNMKSTTNDLQPFLKVGEIFLNKTIYPTERYYLLTNNRHFNLDNNGSLYVNEKFLQGLIFERNFHFLSRFIFQHKFIIILR
jgi:hypothetical protein